jgi:ribonuclease P protein component
VSPIQNNVKKEGHLTENKQFDLVYEKGGARVGKYVIIRTMPNGLSTTRYGFSVSRRIGKAVKRNKVKRRLREIIRNLSLKPGWDIVISARTPAAGTEFSNLEKSLRNLLSQAGLLAGEHEISGSPTD